ncbi:Fungal specific transcription factor domain family protein [Candida albicans]|uniref:Fungal specific transcription factor domain family protein n=1 Tax=Candida albicans TaxID=5476 RepID=A0A8H6BXE4_CANAX|nr:Fungal specific transcription factor domain family protein [Candida albicans]
MPKREIEDTQSPYSSTGLVSTGESPKTSTSTPTSSTNNRAATTTTNNTSTTSTSLLKSNSNLQPIAMTPSVSSTSLAINKPKSQENKRRRVTRACDTCRQKKVKCDGKQPCIHCTVYSYKCSYDQPNIRNKKNSGIPIPSQPSPAILQVSHKQQIMQDPDSQIPPPPPASSSSSHHRRTLSVGSFDDSSNSAVSSPREVGLHLPSKEVALNLIYTTWNKALDLLYSLDPMNYGDRQQKFLPFLYSILACGSLFSKTPYTMGTPSENEKNLEDDGFKYFLEARKLIDISNVGDINSIQTVVMMIIYLQCSARLSTCYSYIGIALRSALKEGLHRNLTLFQNSKKKLDPIEEDTRKRLFYTIYKMDIYINSLLGLPRSLNEDEFDQLLPVELDDENVTRTEYLFDKQQGRLSSSGCANQHTKLMFILSHIIKKMYPIKVKPEEAENSSNVNYSRDRIHAKVTELEVELKNWLDNLPQELKPIDPSSTTKDVIDEVPEKFRLANYYLHLAFLNCQIILYRPFIHFISDSMDGSSSDPRSLIRGRNCIKVARMVVKLANKMIDHKLLLGTYWFSMYTIFFSIACLIYYFHFANYNNNGQGFNYAGILFDDDLNIDMIKKDIEIGKKVLDNLKNSSNSSLRIYNILNTMFEQLNRRTASRSRQVTATTNSTTTTANTNSNSNSNSQPTTLPANFQNVNVKNTFENFDNMNHFVKKERERERESLSQLFDNTSMAKFESSSEIPKNVANIQRVATPLEENNKEIGEVSGGNLTSNYMPGVFDKLDTQIFGKILPPYMLEKNETMNYNSNNNNSNNVNNNFNNNNNAGEVNNNSNGVAYNNNAANWPLNNAEDGLNLEDLFGTLGNNGNGGTSSSNGLEYLDPF